jgi:hypothetical protein
MNAVSSSRLPVVVSREGRAKRIAFWIVSGLLGAGAAIPVVVNLALAGRLTWSLYSLGATVMAWLILAPWFLFLRNRSWISWGAAVVTVPLFLRLVESLAPAKGWLLPLGLPAAALGFAALGGWIGLWCPRRLGFWYGAAFSFVILGILSLAEYLLARPYMVWEVPGTVLGIISLGVGGASAALFLIAVFAQPLRK